MDSKIIKNTYIEISLYLITIITVVYGAMFSLGFGLDYDIFPSLSGGDSTSFAFLVKSIQENGIWGMYFNSKVGAPGMQSLIDFPGADLFMGVVIWLISAFTKSISRIMYVYYIVSFVFDSLPFLFLCRKLGARGDISVVTSVIFTFVPYHFLRGLGHSSLINYMPYVITIYLSLCILGILEKEKKWKIIVASSILGFSYGYYYSFGLILMALAVLMRLIKEADLKKLLSYVWIPISTLIFIAMALSPQIIFGLINGKNQLAGVRQPIEQELYGLKIFQMFLPPSYSKVYSIFPKLGEVYNTYVNSAPLVNENGYATLGVVTFAAFVGLCIAFIYSFSAKEKCNSKTWMMIDFLALSTLALILMGTIGGFGEIFNLYITPQIRCYNRTSIYIAGLSLTFLAVVLNSIKIKYSNIIVPIVCLLLLIVSLFDTVPVGNASGQDAARQTQECYEQFFAEVENSLDEGAMVYQLPYLDYPECRSEYDYKHFVGYLFTDTLRWSYGGVKGRDTEAKDLLINEGMSFRFLKGLQDAGFEAVYIDRAGYEDNGEQVLAFYNSLGITSIVSSDDSLYVFDIRELDIPEVYLEKYFQFVSNWSATNQMNLSIDEIGSLAHDISLQDNATYDVLFDSVADIENEEVLPNGLFIDFCYQNILGREASEDEKNSWTGSLYGGMTRRDVFYAFMNSVEFRKCW